MTAKFDASTDAPTALAARLPMPEDLTLPPLKSLTAKGDVSYGPNLTKLEQVDFTADGEGFNVTYDGSVDASDGIIADGDFTADLNDMSIIDPYLEEPIEGLDLISSVTSKGKVSYGPDSIKLPAIDFAAKGNGIDASFNGSVDLTEGATSTGAFTAKLDDITIVQPFLEEPVEALNILSSVNADGNVEWSGKRFTLTNIKSAVTGTDLSASFNGNATYNEALTLNGTFDGESANVPALVKNAGLDQPDAAALKRLTAKGQIAFNDGKATVSGLTAEASEGLVNGKFSGDVSYAETIGLNGQFSGEIRDLQALDTALPREIPYSDVAKQITISTQIASKAKSYTFSDLTAELKDGLLNGDFKGGLTIGDASSVSGNLTLSADSLRSIAASQDVVLPASTDVGPIFRSFRSIRTSFRHAGENDL